MLREAQIKCRNKNDNERIKKKKFLLCESMNSFNLKAEMTTID